MKIDKSITYITRLGKSFEADEAVLALSSCDLDRMIKALPIKTNPIDRHFLLLSIVIATYKRRDEPKIRKICREVGELHLSEFKSLAAALIEDDKVTYFGKGRLPNVTTFKYLATVLSEDGDYFQAIKVCKMAMKYNLDDGTKGGFEGRIQRIEKMKKAKNEAGS